MIDPILIKVVESSLAVGVMLLLIFVFGRVIRQDFKDAHQQLIEVLKDNHQRMGKLDQAVEQMAVVATEMAKLVLYFEKEKARREGFIQGVNKTNSVEHDS